MQFEQLASYLEKEKGCPNPAVASIPSYDDVIANLQVDGINYNKYNWDFADLFGGTWILLRIL